MSFNLIPTPEFERELKKLSKKYPSVKKDLFVLCSSLENNADTGTPLGNNCFKIRMAITSKNKGKSGGARLITHVKIVAQSIYMLSIYDKSDSETITNEEILSRIKNI
jgi:mRNA-degrading endonuclease RelE of RelBE toxin-antitoxin system